MNKKWFLWIGIGLIVITVLVNIPMVQTFYSHGSLDNFNAGPSFFDYIIGSVKFLFYNPLGWIGIVLLVIYFVMVFRKK